MDCGCDVVSVYIETKRHRHKWTSTVAHKRYIKSSKILIAVQVGSIRAIHFMVGWPGGSQDLPGFSRAESRCIHFDWPGH
jgi:hypothetical protein